MIIIFCQEPFTPKQVDSVFQSEAKAVEEHSGKYHLIDFEELTTGSIQPALRAIPQYDDIGDAVYRGWMLKPHQYQKLYDGLLLRGLRLINTPEMYQHVHYLPESYPIIAGHTPKSIWMVHDENFTFDRVHLALKEFGNRPVVVKDYVKSQKHYWHEACYIPDASDSEHVQNVVKRFLELQDGDLNEGLVFREFVEFQPLTEHSRSGMPLTKEYRVFVMDGQPVFVTKYWSEGHYTDSNPELARFNDIVSRIQSRFFTMDIAQQTTGEWMIVELGDGQVAGLPDHTDSLEFYQALFEQQSK